MSEDLTTQITVDALSIAGAEHHSEPCLVVLTGGSAGMMHRLRPGQVALIGRMPDVQLRFDDRTVSRRHARVTVTADADVIIEDLGSTNGTFVNNERIERRALKNGDKIHIGPQFVLKFCFQDTVEQSAHQELVARGIKDGLTATYNKQYFLDRIETEYQHARRHTKHLALLIFDIDNFKQVNDTHGHPAGDAIIRQVTRLVMTLLRSDDVLARYGGDEFVLLARDSTDAGAVVLAQRIRRAVKYHTFDVHGTAIRLTVSIGIATLSDKVKQATDLLRVADEYLYKAKRAGRDRIRGGRAVMHTILTTSSASTRRAG